MMRWLKRGYPVAVIVLTGTALLLLVAATLASALVVTPLLSIVTGNQGHVAALQHSVDTVLANGITLLWVAALAVVTGRYARAEWEAMKAEVRRTDKDVLDRIEADVDAILRSNSGSGGERSARIDRTPRLEGV